ncbi:hypothetical protein AB834_04255 [PVC group bacterium (ex Bugula neritina AB1)]|nr:hypothetical protein AB834_04255 [PVC group bacterium (ex Bugula neritina AB1)]
MKILLSFFILLLPSIVWSKGKTKTTPNYFHHKKISEQSFHQLFSPHTENTQELLNDLFFYKVIRFSDDFKKNEYIIENIDANDPFFNVVKNEVKALNLFSYMKRTFDYLWNVRNNEKSSYLLPRFVDIDSKTNTLEYEDVPLTSSAGTGFAFASYIMGEKYGWIPLDQLLTRLIKIFNFFDNLSENDIHNGFLNSYYDMETGSKYEDSDFSVLDTSYFVIGSLSVKQYLISKKISLIKSLSQDQIDLDDTVNLKLKAKMKKTRKKIETSMSIKQEHILSINTIVEKIDSIYNKIDWQSALHEGFLVKGWASDTQNILLDPVTNKEALHGSLDASYLAYILAVGSDTFPISKKIWENINRNKQTFSIKDAKDISVAGSSLPLSDHVYPQCFLDMRDYSFDGDISSLPKRFHKKFSHTVLNFKDSLDFQYFDNAVKAVQYNRQYTRDIANSLDETAKETSTYSSYWGLSDSWSSKYIYDELRPSQSSSVENERVSPTAALSAINFNEIAVYNQFERLLERKNFIALNAVEFFPEILTDYGFTSSFTFSNDSNDRDAVSLRLVTKEKGAEFLAIENFLAGSIWSLISTNKNINLALESLEFPTILSPRKSPAIYGKLTKTLDAPVVKITQEENNFLDSLEVTNEYVYKIESDIFSYVDYYDIEVSEFADFNDSQIFKNLRNENLGYILFSIPLNDGKFFFRVRGSQSNEVVNENSSNNSNLSNACYTLWSEAVEIKTYSESSSKNDIEEVIYMKDLLKYLKELGAKKGLIKSAERYISLLKKYDYLLNTDTENLTITESWQKLSLPENATDGLTVLRKKHPKRLGKIERLVQEYKEANNLSEVIDEVKSSSDIHDSSSLTYMKNLLEKLTSKGSKKMYINRANNYISLLKKYDRIIASKRENLAYFEKQVKKSIENGNHNSLSFLRKKYPKRLAKLESLAG